MSASTSINADSLRSARAKYEAEAGELLLKPVEQFLRARPIRRALEATQECDRAIPVRALRARIRIDQRFHRLLAQTALDLCEPWRIRRSGNPEDEWRDWRQRRDMHAKEAAAILEQYARWARDTPKQDDSNQNGWAIEHRDRWWRQQRAVNALLEMEVSFCELGRMWFDATEDLRDGLLRERREMIAQAERTLHWIQSVGGSNSDPNAETLELATPEERLRSWTHRIISVATERLPERVELVTPGRYVRWSSVAARNAFLTAFGTYAKAPMSQIIEEYWSDSARVVRESVRAREIVAYWREAPSSNPGTQAAEANTLFSDALRNAAAMLAQQIQTPEAAEELDAKLNTAFRTWVAEGFTSIESGLYGWLVLLQRARGRRLLHAAVRLEIQGAEAQGRRAGRWIGDRWERTLEAFGGKFPAKPPMQPVVRRTTLRDTLSLPASKRELPELYRLLFRLAPVEDRRFLVGRDEELGGLDQALKDWDAGRFAACLVVGARGSGKTSLLNCATAELFANRPLIRGQFRERALDGPQIDAFLRELLHLPEDVDIEAALTAERRVLMIEESERMYLRKVGGFVGAHHLIHLIHRTASTTLWILVLNDKAFRVLDAGARLGRVFSHRINAMSVSRDDLEKAILERHRLSGLRLEFAPPPAGDPRVSRIRKWLGLQDSPQKLFFDSLFQQSEGVFRSALELWLSSIERIEGETLRIRQPLDPAFNKFRSELAQEDHFTLLVIQEHGSLTQDELAEVLCEDPRTSRSRMERLWALGLIEADPEHLGLRVRPEAQRFANDLLRRANLT